MVVDPPRERDRGSALVLLLLLILVVSFLALPMMSYLIAIMKANTVLSDKTRHVEATRAAFRVAMADTVGLYDTCGEAGVSVSRPLATAEITGVAVSSRCYFIDFAAAENEEEKRWGLVTTQVGAAIPVELSGTRDEWSSDDPSEWLANATILSVTDRIWLPNLPVHPRTPRSSIPHRMPAGFPDCNVYYPGTYTDPLVLDGPTFFTSGIYYFESEVRVIDGADVLVGQGVLGCSNDQDVAFYAENPPAAHHITGHGATFVFGAGGRLVVDSKGSAPLSLRFSPRYVQPEDSGGTPSVGVSIATVNGWLDGGVASALDVPGLLHVPLSRVGSTDVADAPDHHYAPSTLTPMPTAPSAPTAVSVTPLNGHVRVLWSPPDSHGGSPLTGYEIEVHPVANPSAVATCSTPVGRTDCTLGGLTNGQAHHVTVVALNDVGPSVRAEAPATVVPSGTLPAVVVPSAPTGVSVSAFDGAVEVSWVAPANDGGAPATRFVVAGSPAGSCEAGYGESSCVVTGIAPLADPAEYTFTVLARNLAGDSPVSSPSPPAQPVGPPWSDPVEPEQPPVVLVPEAVVEIFVADGADAVVEIPGYVAVPQGRVHVHNPGGAPVSLRGGIIAATIDVLDGRAGDPAQPGQVPIGFIETVVQRKFRIVSETVGQPRVVSTAVVQVNANGAYAINSWEIR